MNDRNIRKILKEEIYNMLLSESVDFNALLKLSSQLESWIKKLGAYNSSAANNDVKQYLYDLEYYSLQIVFAVKRCVQAQNLNEDFSFSKYGIEMPSELTFWNDAKKGYYDTRRFMNGLLGGNSYSSGNASGTNHPSPNNVKSEKLLSLLPRLNQYINRKSQLESKYGFRMDDSTVAPSEILSCIKKIQDTVNAQGQP